VFGFLNGWEDSKAIDFATAVAAIVCTRTPGVLNAPGYEEVTEFMQIPL
jgi:sugar/nucleoside kinase (ribokinase family)